MPVIAQASQYITHVHTQGLRPSSTALPPCPSQECHATAMSALRGQKRPRELECTVHTVQRAHISVCAAPHRHGFQDSPMHRAACAAAARQAAASALRAQGALPSQRRTRGIKRAASAPAEGDPIYTSNVGSLPYIEFLRHARLKAMGMSPEHSPCPEIALPRTRSRASARSWFGNDA